MPPIRVALAQIRPSKGDYAANLDKLGGVLAEAGKVSPAVDLVVAPETATSGYFVEGGVRDVAVTAGTLFEDLQARHAAAKVGPIDVAIGFYEILKTATFNSCLYATLGKKGKVRHVHRKVFLPTYGVFDEERFVDRGHEIQAFRNRLGRSGRDPDCEDAWHSLSGTIAAPGWRADRDCAERGPGPRDPARRKMVPDFRRVLSGGSGCFAGLPKSMGSMSYTPTWSGSRVEKDSLVAHR